jgi:hypothetical protein
VEAAGQAESAESPGWRGWAGFERMGAGDFSVIKKTTEPRKIPKIFIALVEMGG